MYITGKKHIDEIILELSSSTLKDIILYKEALDLSKKCSLSEEDKMKLHYRNLLLDKGLLQKPRILS